MKSSKLFSFFTAVLLTFVLLQTAVAQTPQTMLNPSNPFLQANVETIDPTGWLYFKNSSEVKEGELFGTYKTNMGLGADDAMVFQQAEIDEMGNSHNRYQQYHKGYLVEGAEMIEHLANCKVVMANGKLIENLNGNTTGTISESTALQFALAIIGANIYAWQDTTAENGLKQIMEDPLATYFPKGALLWSYPALTSFGPTEYKLCWAFSITALNPASSQKVYVNAKNGSIEKKDSEDKSNGPAVTLYNGTRIMDTKWHGGFHQHFHLIANDAGRNIETRVGAISSNPGEVNDGDDIWGIGAILSSSAHWAATESWHYFKTNHNRTGWKNNGSRIPVFAGSPLVNSARFSITSQAVEFGTSDGTIAALGPAGTNLAAIDVVGHEYTHGIVNKTSKLIGTGEPGALDESFADIFGELVQESGTGTQIDWVAGTDLGGGGFRSISNPDAILQPSLAGPGCGLPITGQPINYMGANWVPTTSLMCDGGGIHINSGVQNRWFFLLAQGGTQNGIVVEAIGVASAARIVYMNMTAMLTSASNYPASRVGSIAAATALFGACSNEVRQTTNAWAAVMVGATFAADCVTVTGPGGICANSPSPYSSIFKAKASGPNPNFTWSYPTYWNVTLSGPGNNTLTVNSMTPPPPVAINISISATCQYGTDFENVYIHPCTGEYSNCVGSSRNSGDQTFSSDRQFTAFPNPTNSKIQFNWFGHDVFDLKISNTTGNEVFGALNYRSGDDLDMSSLPNGIYFIEARDKESLTIGKFVKIN